jgi:hypothetical protein
MNYLSYSFENFRRRKKNETDQTRIKGHRSMREMIQPRKKKYKKDKYRKRK